MSKENRVNLRFSDDEHKLLLQKKGDIRLTTFCRNLILEKSSKMKRKSVTKFRNVDPDLLRAINAIGNNLNQVVRLGHVARKSSSLDVVALLLSIEVIRDDLSSLLESDDDC